MFQEISRTYWLDLLADYHYSHLPHRSPPLPPEQVSRFAVYHMPLPAGEIHALKHIAQLAQVPLKSVLLAAHLRVLGMLSGQTDVLTGLVTNGRLEENDGERLLGLFLNTVPLRLSLTGGSWLNLMQQTFQAEQAMLPHRRYPLAEIQQQMGGHALFEVAFNYVHFHVAESLHRLDNFAFEEELAYTETNVPFTADFVQVVPSNELFLHLEYTTALLSEQQVSAIGAYYVQALSAMIANPHQRYETVSLLSRQEQERALVLWSQEQHRPLIQKQPSVCLHQLFEAQVARTPEGIAVIAGQDQLTYRQLDEKANQLAHYLIQLGVGPEELIGVCLERSSLLIVALLGILKAGGAYVPLETTYPAERLNFMLSDAQVSLLLTSRSLLDSQSVFYTQDLQILCLDELQPSFNRQATTSPEQAIHPDQLAYVIYTSGSTGKPKGAVISHRAIAVFALSAGRAYELDPEDRVLQSTSLSWDTSAEEIYPCLTHGATLVLRPATMLDAPALFLARCQELRVSVLNLPTAYWHALCSTLILQDVPIADHRRLVIIGGEKVHAEHVERWRAAVAPSIRLLNTYGVAETTVEATYMDLAEIRSSPQFSQEIPIGRPFCDCRVYVLDSYQQPVPVGVAGEVYLGGPGIVRGYLGRPALTAERFVPDRFGTEPGQRLYKTGDLARYRMDGVLEYVGRVDEQVKIRGYRIEVAMIREVVVMACEDATGDKQLVAYVVSTGEAISEREVRQFVQERLPAHMLPTRIMQLEALPLTTNGKVDRQRLPRPELARTERSEIYVAPDDPVEVQLVEIWEKVLGVQGIGVQDDFFELGGHSLFAMQIVTRVRDAFGIEISLSTFFKAPVIKKLAESIVYLLLQEIDALDEEEAQQLAIE
jgi:amino acid adenylation domain-containing protein